MHLLPSVWQCVELPLGTYLSHRPLPSRAHFGIHSYDQLFFAHPCASLVLRLLLNLQVKHPTHRVQADRYISAGCSAHTHNDSKFADRKWWLTRAEDREM